MLSLMLKDTRIEITPKSILIFFGIWLALYFLWLVRDVLVVLFLSLIVMATLSSSVNWLERLIKWRTLAVLIVFFLIGAVVVLLITPLIPPLIAQTQEVVNNLPQYTEQASWLANFSQQVKNWWLASGYSLRNLADSLSQSGSQIFQFTGSVLTVIGAAIIIIIISFYGLIAEKGLKSNLKRYLPKNRQQDYWQIGRKIYQALGAWLRARIVLGIVVGILVGVGLKLLGLPFALLLGVLAGILDIIPVLGPVFAAIPALLIGFALSPLTGVLVLIWLLIVYQVENYLLLPKIMGRVLGLSPVWVLVALVLGAKLGGIVGVVIAIPAAAVVVILFQEITRLYEKAGHQSKSKG